MEISAIEREYIERNSSYMLERILIDSMNDTEILGFITPLKYEYDILKGTVETEYKMLLKKHNDLGDISKYFLYKVLELQIWGKRLNELKEVLTHINSLLFPKLTQSYISHEKYIDIKEVPIASIIEQYTKIPWNLNHNIRCPFVSHEDKSASFKIYKTTNSWFCFWCNKGWNILNFISEIEWITTKEAYKKLLSLI